MECPTALDLFVFTQGRQPNEKASQIAVHLGSCSQCDAFVDGLLEEERRRSPEPPPGYEISDEDAALGLAALKLMTGGHLTAQLLIAYHEGTLGRVDQGLVREHLATCKACADSVLDQAERGGRSWKRFLARYGDYLFGKARPEDGEAGDEDSTDSSG